MTFPGAGSCQKDSLFKWRSPNPFEILITDEIATSSLSLKVYFSAFLLFWHLNSRIWSENNMQCPNGMVDRSVIDLKHQYPYNQRAFSFITSTIMIPHALDSRACDDFSDV